MGNQTNNDSATLRAVEQLYRELRELRAVTDSGFTQLGADVSALRKTQADTERKISATAAWNDLKFDAITWATLLSIIFVSQVYVAAVRNAPGWLKTMLPGMEQPAADGGAPAGAAESKHVVAFSRPGELLRKGAPLEGTPYSVSSTVGWRHIFGAKDWHEGYDVPTPIGTPLYTVLPVEVQCGSSGGGGLHATYTVGSEQHFWIHLASCTPGSYGIGEVFAKTGNSGSRTTGAHLDYRVKDLSRGEWVRPYADVLRLTLNPDAAIAMPKKAASTSTSPSDDLLKRAIGRAEGTRDRNGNPTAAFQGHKDPGWSGRCKNQGSFSYQHCASSPDEADRKWLEVLRKAEGDIQAQAQEKFGQPLSMRAVVAALDAYTQSPDAGGKRFVKHLATADPTPEQLVAARIAALTESRRVLGGPPMNVPADQQRRVNALLEQL